MGTRRARATAGRRRAGRGPVSVGARRAALVGALLVVTALAGAWLLLDGSGGPRAATDLEPGAADVTGAAGSSTRAEDGSQRASGAARVAHDLTSPRPDAAPLATPPDSPPGAVQPKRLQVFAVDPFDVLIGSAHRTWRVLDDPAARSQRFNAPFQWSPAQGRRILVQVRYMGWGREERILDWDTFDGEPLRIPLAADVSDFGILQERNRAAGRAVQLTLRGRAEPLALVRTGPHGRFPVRFEPERLESARVLEEFTWGHEVIEEFVPLEITDLHPLTLERTAISRHAFVLVDGDDRPLDELVRTGGLDAVQVLADPPSQSGVARVQPGAGALVILSGEGPATLRLVTPTHRSAPVVVQREPGGETRGRTLKLFETGGYTGTVRDDRGRAVAAAWVARVDAPEDAAALGWPASLDPWAPPPAPPPGVVASASDGRFFGLPHAPGTLVVLHPAFRPLELPLGGVADDLRLVLDPGLGLVLQHERKPFATRAEVRVESDLSGVEPVRRVTFDANGRALVPALAAGRHEIRLWRDDRLTGVDEVELFASDDGVREHVLDPRPVRRWELSVPARLHVTALRVTPEEPELGRVVDGVPLPDWRPAHDDPTAEAREAFVLEVPWKGYADLELRRAVDGVPDELTAWQSWGRVHVAGSVDRDLTPPPGVLRVGLDLPEGRAPFRVDVVDPLAPGAPVVASARLARVGAVPVFDGLPTGFYRVDVTEAEGGLEPGAFLGQVTVALTEEAPTEARVLPHDGATAELLVHVRDAAGQPVQGAEVEAWLVRTRLARGRTQGTGRARLTVPAGVRGAVSVRHADGRRAARVAYQSPGARALQVTVEDPPPGPR